MLDEDADMKGTETIVRFGRGVELESLVRLASGLPNFMWFDGGNNASSLLVWGQGSVVLDSQLWKEEIRSSLRKPQTLNTDKKRLFTGGVAGIWGYEFGARCEVMPTQLKARPHPDLFLRRYEGGLTYEHSSGEFVAAGSDDFVMAALKIVRQAKSSEVRRGVASASTHVESPDDAEFVDGVSRILDKISAGDCYQVNLSRRIVFTAPTEPLESYLKLREHHPAEMGAFISMPSGYVLSNSPELFLKIEDGTVETRPIKGTRPRTGSEEEDAAALSELEASEKEIAELTMIADLARNDLSRIAIPGSVCCEPRRVFELPTLFHADQRITCSLRDSLDVVDVIEATFPPASVTGAPKVQAMKTIHELEPVSRGIYTGAIGWLSDSGDAQLSVAIRTLSVQGESAHLHLGSGIVADSDPYCELDESKWKGAAIINAITDS